MSAKTNKFSEKNQGGGCHPPIKNLYCKFSFINIEVVFDHETVPKRALILTHDPYSRSASDERRVHMFEYVMSCTNH